MIRKGLIVLFIFSLFLIMFRFITFADQWWNLKFAANDLVSEQAKMGKETEINDADIIIGKILTKSSFQYAINPFVWTMKQRSDNDDLLQACLDAAERDNLMDAMRYTEDLSTFESRFSKWEVNFEMAKLSIEKDR